MTSEIEYQCNNCGHEGINTRAVPEGVHTAHIPAPALVRYDGSMEGMWKDPNGEYVRYDQAAAMLAAKDEEIVYLRINRDSWRRVAERCKSEANIAKAELAQIKEQVPVAWVDVTDMKLFTDWTPKFSPIVLTKSKTDDDDVPLYAAPVDQTAEIERYRKALTLIANKKAGLDLHDARDISRAALSGKSPS